MPIVFCLVMFVCVFVCLVKFMSKLCSQLLLKDSLCGDSSDEFQVEEHQEAEL